MKLLYQPLHDLPKVLFILNTEHANKVNDFLDKRRILEVYTLNQSDKYVFVIIYQVSIEILKQNNIPINNDFTSICLLFVKY